MAATFPKVGSPFKPFKALPIRRLGPGTVPRTQRPFSTRDVDWKRPEGTPPLSFPGSEPEWIAISWLEDHGYRMGIDYEYQQAYGGGRTRLGGLMLDIVMIDRPKPLIISVIGAYFHEEARDFVEHVRLLNAGYDHVRVRESDLRTRADATMRNAVAGKEIF